MNRKKYILLLIGEKMTFISALLHAYLPKYKHIYLSYYLFSVPTMILN